MSENPKLSIITVNLNNRDGLQRTIDSVVSQTFIDYEWIVIDGGSTDGSRELIEQYQDHFAYWCSEPDKGIYNAMNKGIAHAKGEWLQFLNSGDWLYEKETIEKIFSYQYNADVLYGNVILQSKNGNLEYRNYPDTLNIHFFYDHSLCHQSTMLKRTLFYEKKYNEKLLIASDWEYNLKLFSENHLFQHIPFFVSVFSIDGISSKLEAENIKERKKVLLEYIPTYYKQDVELYAQVKEKDSLIRNHKILHRIAVHQEKKLLFAAKIIKTLEKIRIKLNK